MSHDDIVRRYPRLATAILAVAEETDTNWAAGILSSVMNRRSPFSVGIVREAWRKRHVLRNKEALRAVKMLSGNVDSIPTSKLPHENLGVA